MKYCEPAIYELLKDLAGGRVTVMQAVQNSATPFIVFQRVDSERWRSINGPSGVAQAYIQIDCYASTFYAAKELGAQVETILDGYMGTVYHGTNSPQDEFVVIGGISLQSDFDIYDQTDDPKLFRNTAQYLVTYDT